MGMLSRGIGCCLLMALASGCIRSRVIVTSDPPGADVTMNGIHRGKTPIEIPFTWYWFYDFELKQEGYQPMWIRERFRAPVYLWTPLDAVMEAMPFSIYDTKNRHYVLVAQPNPSRTAISSESSPADNLPPGIK